MPGGSGGGGGGSRKEAEVRRLLDAAPPVVPVDLLARATARGARLLRLRRTVRLLLWAVLVAAALVFTVWAWTVHPWYAPPAETTPPLEDCGGC
ncbi:hypothetical protein [Streptomyces sp. NPDC093109]|uniref:hypothetical protein n=1 Tax=Streptomyces sp. NPDC093109 TaxID=3154977 RepID=UPI00344D2F82